MSRLSSARAVCTILAVVALAGCGRKQSSAGEVTDTNTNWLKACDDDATCGDLSCLCGRCTVNCEDVGECSRFDESAVCERPSSSKCDARNICLLSDDATTDARSNATCNGAECNSESSNRATTGDDSATSERSGSSTSVGSESATATSATASVESADGKSSSSADEATATSVTDSTSTDDACALAQPDASCDSEGATCGECTNPCQFCNLLRCTEGVWQAMEAFPAPCVDCGEALQCNTLDSYCSVVDDATYSCESYPTACSGDHSCGCLEAEVAGFCSGEGSELTVTSGRSVVDQCSCTVWFSDSTWCGEIDGPDGGAYPVEWVCDPQTDLFDALNTECTEMATGAARWCCPSSFQPTCL